MKHLITITADNHYSLKLTYTDSEGQLIDLTNATARFVLRRSMYSPVLIDVPLQIDESTSTLAVNLIPDDTRGLLDNVVSEDFIFGVQLVLGDGTTSQLLTGKAEIQQAIVRD